MLARERRQSPDRNSVSPIEIDLAQCRLRELNQRLHHLPPGKRAAPGASRTRMARMRSPAVSMPTRRRDPRACRLLLRRDEQARGRARPRQRGTGVAENIMSRRGAASRASPANRPAAPGHGGLVIIDGDASARCGISMKGVDIVVGGSVGHLSAFMAQAGRSSCAATPATNLGDSIYEARASLSRGQVAASAPTASRRRSPEPRSRGSPAARRAPASPLMRRSSAATARRGSSITSTSTTPRSIEAAHDPACASPPPFRPRHDRRDPARGREGLYEIRGFGAKRRVPNFDDLLLLGASHLALPARGLPRALRDRCRARHPFREQADRARRSRSQSPG